MWDDRGGCPGHEWGDEIEGKSQSGALNGSTLDGAPPGKERRPEWSSQFCIHCHAWLGSLGLEPTPELYLKHLVDIFREIKRVLRKDGTVWLNLGDSYANDTKWGGKTGGKHVSSLHGEPIGRTKRNTGLKPNDLCGIPWRAALALQADGWWLRSDIIWHKPNPMPESCKDRPTKSHEYVFLLS
ncbi:MAG: DNA methyltransferase, partial [Pseudomonadota bacterium]